ncbi:MAG: hypothetical protein ACRBBP_04410 [Bdellovibrionales bacterium]
MKAFLFITTLLIVTDVFGAALFSPSRPQRRMTPRSSRTTSTGTCVLSNPQCGGTTIRVDVSARCMCIKDECFPVSIGSGGPSWTHNGTSVLGPTGGIFDRNRRGAGGIYETKSTTTNSYDNDAIAMGIPGNDAVGKWFHKPANCVHPSRYATAGCVAVPCEHWANLKSNVGTEVTVCGGRGRGGLFRRSPPPSLSGMINRVTENAAYVDQIQGGSVQ